MSMRNKLIKIISGLIGFFLFFQINFWLPGTGGNICALTTAEEQKLGEDAVREVEKEFSVIHDPLLLEYLNRLGQEILKQAGPQPYPFRFYLLKDPQLNAFSVPGGHVFVTTGIIQIMNSEAELAGLLGHEITHVTHHHISRQMEKQKKIGLATMAAVLLGILAGDPNIADGHHGRFYGHGPDLVPAIQSRGRKRGRQFWIQIYVQDGIQSQGHDRSVRQPSPLGVIWFRRDPGLYDDPSPDRGPHVPY